MCNLLQLVGAYYQPESAPIIEELCSLLKNVNMEPLFANSAEADYPEERYSHLLGICQHYTCFLSMMSMALATLCKNG